jgi:hypothetical protein
VAAADEGDKEVVRLLIESGATMGAPQKSREDMENCSAQGVNHRHSKKDWKISWSAFLGVVYADQGKQSEAEQMYSIAWIGLLSILCQQIQRLQSFS